MTKEKPGAAPQPERDPERRAMIEMVIRTVDAATWALYQQAQEPAQPVETYANQYGGVLHTGQFDPLAQTPNQVYVSPGSLAVDSTLRAQTGGQENYDQPEGIEYAA